MTTNTVHGFWCSFVEPSPRILTLTSTHMLIFIHLFKRSRCLLRDLLQFVRCSIARV